MPGSSSKRKKTAGSYAVVVSRFNEFICQRLLDGCLNEFQKKGIAKSRVQVYWVAGALEIPVLAQKLLRKRGVCAVVALGCVIRGETYHFELVAQGVAQGLMRVSLDEGKPVAFGVITTETVEQAYKRSEEQGDNKGREAALVAMKMVETMDSI
ncbi:MAG TPA: 6,7-dimethyl-8-ribityllumazine synthase [Candidatus Omnitrophota bacterium]|nr:6,7-dimethyl-8-ribityllumazine synthase [Candidatus Omnitrophota bacterium]HSA31612.1 6,7-dimethyl-8-ribityllumazine synthase [Candidatus Omnitrophota bacterium]